MSEPWAVEAVQDYNAGLTEQYGTNTSVLCQLTKVKPTLIKVWMNEHDDLLKVYSDTQGHIYQQNCGEPNARAAMKWSEAAYGEYE